MLTTAVVLLSIPALEKHRWLLVKRDIAKETITTEIRLIEKLIQVWYHNPRIQEIIQSCIESMLRKIEAVI